MHPAQLQKDALARIVVASNFLAQAEAWLAPSPTHALAAPAHMYDAGKHLSSHYRPVEIATWTPVPASGLDLCPSSEQSR
jgi:hypothetical protein